MMEKANRAKRKLLNQRRVVAIRRTAELCEQQHAETDPVKRRRLTLAAYRSFVQATS